MSSRIRLRLRRGRCSRHGGTSFSLLLRRKTDKVDFGGSTELLTRGNGSGALALDNAGRDMVGHPLRRFSFRPQFGLLRGVISSLPPNVPSEQRVVAAPVETVLSCDRLHQRLDSLPVALRDKVTSIEAKAIERLQSREVFADERQVSLPRAGFQEQRRGYKE